MKGVRWQKCTCPPVRLLYKQNHATDIIKLCIDSPLLRCKSYYKMKKEKEEDKGRGEGEEELEKERKEHDFHNIPPLSDAKETLLFFILYYLLSTLEVLNNLHQARWYRTISNSFWHRVGRCLVKLVPSF